MIVVTRSGGYSGLGACGPSFPSAAAEQMAQGRTVHALQNLASRPRMLISPSGGYSGLGAFDTSSIPMWAYAAGGGLLAGVIVGALVFKRKKR